MGQDCKSTRTEQSLKSLVNVRKTLKGRLDFSQALKDGEDLHKQGVAKRREWSRSSIAGGESVHKSFKGRSRSGSHGCGGLRGQ